MNKEERLKIYSALAAPFAEEAVERTDGRLTGRGYSTTGIKYQYVVNRLNDVLGVGGYRVHRSLSVKEVTTAKGRPAFDAICEIRLELGQWVDGVFSVFAEAIGDGGHTGMSEADARKGAYTNAFKKTAAFFGVGRQAYEGTLDDDNVPADGAPPSAPASNPAAIQPSPTPNRPTSVEVPSAPVSSGEAPGRLRLTQKQLGLLWTLAQEQGIANGEFRTRVRAKFGVQPEYLTRTQASELITILGAAHQNGTGPGSPQPLRQPGGEG